MASTQSPRQPTIIRRKHTTNKHLHPRHTQLPLHRIHQHERQKRNIHRTHKRTRRIQKETGSRIRNRLEETEEEERRRHERAARQRHDEQTRVKLPKIMARRTQQNSRRHTRYIQRTPNILQRPLQIRMRTNTTNRNSNIRIPQRNKLKPKPPDAPRTTNHTVAQSPQKKQQNKHKEYM